MCDDCDTVPDGYWDWLAEAVAQLPELPEEADSDEPEPLL